MQVLAVGGLDGGFVGTVEVVVGALVEHHDLWCPRLGGHVRTGVVHRLHRRGDTAAAARGDSLAAETHLLQTGVERRGHQPRVGERGVGAVRARLRAEDVHALRDRVTEERQPRLRCWWGVVHHRPGGQVETGEAQGRRQRWCPPFAAFVDVLHREHQLVRTGPGSVRSEPDPVAAHDDGRAAHAVDDGVDLRRVRDARGVEPGRDPAAGEPQEHTRPAGDRGGRPRADVPPALVTQHRTVRAHHGDGRGSGLPVVSGHRGGLTAGAVAGPPHRTWPSSWTHVPSAEPVPMGNQYTGAPLRGIPVSLVRCTEKWVR